MYELICVGVCTSEGGGYLWSQVSAGWSMSVGWGLAGGGFVDGRYPIEELVCQGWVCQSGQVSWGEVGIPGGGWVFQGGGGYAS